MTLVAREETANGVAVLTLDRPRANAFSRELVEDLRRSLAESRGARGVVLASSQRIFSGGWDLTIVGTLERSAMSEFVASYTDLVREVFTYPTPVVAALPGHAIAGGLILASAADERIAADGPWQLGLSEVALAVPVPRALLEVFRYMLGDRAAERLAAGGENLSLARAVAIGLVDAVVPPQELRDRAVERVAALGERPRSAHAEIKRRSRAEAIARFDAARRDDPFLDFWFAPEARAAVAALVAKLKGK